jgi:hypothetical protein
VRPGSRVAGPACQRIGQALELARPVGHHEATQEPAANVRVDHADRLAERKAGDRARGIWPDPRQPLQAFDVTRPSVASTAAGEASASEAAVGNRSIQAGKRSAMREAWVCWSITSLTRTA